MVVFNARVRTIDPRTPIAEAFAIRAGRFVAVGSNQNIKALIGSKSQTWDARQMAIVPASSTPTTMAVGKVLLYDVLVVERAAGMPERAARDHGHGRDDKVLW